MYPVPHADRAPTPSPLGREDFDRAAAAERIDLYRYARYLTRSGPDAEDLVQETLLRALRSWRTFQSGTGIGPWLRTIMYHQFVNDCRARKGVETLSELHAAALTARAPDSSGGDPETALAARELREAVARAVARLSRGHRDAVGLSDLEGYSDDEAAAVLGVPLGTLKSRLWRARRLLRVSLRTCAADLAGAGAIGP